MKYINDIEYINKLVEKAQQGNNEAFNQLVLIYNPRVQNIARKYLIPTSDLSDISQEVFIKVYKYIKGFKGESSFYTWLYAVATSVIKNYLMTSSKTPILKGSNINATEYLDFISDFHENHNPQDILVSDETRDIIINTVNNLPDCLREVIMLREIEGLSYLDIATVLHIPEGTVRSRIHRARSIIEHNINQ